MLAPEQSSFCRVTLLGRGFLTWRPSESGPGISPLLSRFSPSEKTPPDKSRRRAKPADGSAACGAQSVSFAHRPIDMNPSVHTVVAFYSILIPVATALRGIKCVHGCTHVHGRPSNFAYSQADLPGIAEATVRRWMCQNNTVVVHSCFSQ